MSIPKPPRKGASAEQIAVRKIRVVQWLQAGLPYEEIAGLGKISRRRVREVVVEALKARDEDAPADRPLLNELMLAPALRLAAKAIVEGKLERIDRLDKLRTPMPRRLYAANARQKLLAKLDAAKARRAKNALEASANP